MECLLCVWEKSQKIFHPHPDTFLLFLNVHVCATYWSNNVIFALLKIQPEGRCELIFAWLISGARRPREFVICNFAPETGHRYLMNYAAPFSKGALWSCWLFGVKLNSSGMRSSRGCALLKSRQRASVCVCVRGPSWTKFAAQPDSSVRRICENKSFFAVDRGFNVPPIPLLWQKEFPASSISVPRWHPKPCTVFGFSGKANDVRCVNWER